MHRRRPSTQRCFGFTLRRALALNHNQVVRLCENCARGAPRCESGSSTCGRQVGVEDVEHRPTAARTCLWKSSLMQVCQYVMGNRGMACGRVGSTDLPFNLGSTYDASQTHIYTCGVVLGNVLVWSSHARFELWCSSSGAVSQARPAWHNAYALRSLFH